MLLKASFSSYSENMLKLCGRPATADPTKSVTKVKAAEWVWRQFQLRHGGEVSVGNISTMLTEFAARVPSDVDLQWYVVLLWLVVVLWWVVVVVVLWWVVVGGRVPSDVDLQRHVRTRRVTLGLGG